MLFIPLSVSRSSITDTFIFNLYENKKKLSPYENKKLQQQLIQIPV